MTDYSQSLIEKLYELKLRMPCGLTRNAAIDDCIAVTRQHIEPKLDLPGHYGTAFPDPTIRQHQAAQGDVVSALKRLVDLKEHKDAHGKNNWYVKNQKDAWDQAKAAIAAMNMGDVNDKHVVEMPEAIEKHDIHSEILDNSDCRKAYDQWCRNERLCDTTFAPWNDSSWKPSYAWQAFQAAWEARSPKPVAAGEFSDNIEGVCAVYENLMAQYKGGLVYHPHTAAAQVWSMRKALEVYVPKPVVVSLDKCSKAIPLEDGGVDMKQVAKAVLDSLKAQGVEFEYVE